MAPKIGVALGGGGIRGFAHLGVLKVLKKHGIPIHMVAGSSAGSIAASLAAVGADLDIVEQVLLSLNLKKLMNVSLHRTGFVDGNNLVETVRLLTKNKNIEDADIDLRIIATDLIKRETVEFDRGNIAEAVRASVAIPGIFTPIKKDGKILVDGCVLNHCPGDVVKNMGADLVLAVDL
ncbi:MAG: patatin-like phospholipase family protein, partial [Clostridia bacterium]|nr:patatin-like phospholipase family protein [Clostridia bacterium]